MPKVYNKRNAPKGAVYVGRPSKWGNHFAMNGESERDAVCDKYDKWIASRIDLMNDAKKELRGRDLVCFCAPKRCHADTLLRIANEGDAA